MLAYLNPLSVVWHSIQYRQEGPQGGPRDLASAAAMLDVVGHHHNNGMELVPDFLL